MEKTARIVRSFSLTFQRILRYIGSEYIVVEGSTAMSVQNVAEQFRDYVKKANQYQEASFLVMWDIRTGAPRKGASQRAEVYGMLAGEQFRMSVSPEMKAFLDVLAAPEALEQLDEVTRASVLERKKVYDRYNKIPPQEWQDFVVLTSKSEQVWEVARKENDFAKLQPYLEQIVAKLIEFTEYYGYEENKYDALLENYEPGMTVAKIDKIFQPLRDRSVQLLQRIKEKEQPRRDFLFQNCDIDTQREFNEFVLKRIGYDFEAGRLDVSAHPFATPINMGDVRITTRYLKDDVRYALFGTIHECGHAMYEQNISPDLLGTFCGNGASMGVHESQSRFMENMVGRSREFWTYFYGDFVKAFPQFHAVTADEFYRAVNTVEQSLIRTEADELTYNLHIMIRYEIEKGLINGEIAVADLPKIWNQKMEEYLGVTPPDDADGVMQDTHWPGGAFGYFPSYTLGNIYSAQIEHALRQDIPNYKEQIASGEFKPMTDWLTEKIWKHGRTLTPREIMTAVTGEEINGEYLIRYLEAKYQAVYGL